jgi:predicted double-glycine peptidase
MSLDKLRRLHIPAIVLISPNGYNHFVVVRGWRNDAAIVADPRLGVRRMPSEDFKAVWNGVVFLLKDNTKQAERHYNDISDFKLVPRSVVLDGMYYGNQSASEFLINIPIFNNY